MTKARFLSAQAAKVFFIALLSIVGIFFYSSCKKSGADVQWLTLEQALEKSKENPRPIMIDVYTDWCGWCKKMDETTFGNSDVASYINDKFYAVKLNAEGDRSMTYMDREVTERELAEEVFGVEGFPTIVFLNPKENTVDLRSGYQKAAEFKATLKEFADL